MQSNTIFEAIAVGFITMIIGKIVFSLTLNKNNIMENKPFGLEISFFATGFFLHIIVELIGWNKYMCDKQCKIN